MESEFDEACIAISSSTLVLHTMEVELKYLYRKKLKRSEFSFQQYLNLFRQTTEVKVIMRQKEVGRMIMYLPSATDTPPSMARGLPCILPLQEAITSTMIARLPSMADKPTYDNCYGSSLVALRWGRH